MKKIGPKLIPLVIGIIIGVFLSLYLARTALYHVFSTEIKQTNELMQDEEFRIKVNSLGMENVWREVKLWADKKPIISPKMEELLTLQFGHSDIGKITDKEAQLILDSTWDYIQIMAWSDAPVSVDGLHENRPTTNIQISKSREVSYRKFMIIEFSCLASFDDNCISSESR